MTFSDDADDLEERRNAELEFVTSAYTEEEAWSETNETQCVKIQRRLCLNSTNTNSINVLLTLVLPRDYPEHAPLQVSARVENSSQMKSFVVKVAWDALPLLVESCRTVAEHNKGEEAVFAVLSHADEWIQDEWPRFTTCIKEPSNTSAENNNDATPYRTLGRRLIYSHHIISKVKRAAIKQLASSYGLTGYMKIGWPGLILIEGEEEHCVAFYDEIRPMSWQYLVVRGEQQQQHVRDMDATRKFDSFREVDDMSVVAQHCREVGLEALFRTSMKVYDNSNNLSDDDVDVDDSDEISAALVHVDHMNSGKQYRKWLRKTAQELDCLLLIQQCYPNDDFSKRPLILVGIVGKNVSAFLKRWRTSRVDVDSRGRPCLERQMTVLLDGPLGPTTNNLSQIDWEQMQGEGSHLNVSFEHLENLVATVGGSAWLEALRSIKR